MAGKKNPNLGDKLRQEREGAENTLRDSRSKTAEDVYKRQGFAFPKNRIFQMGGMYGSMSYLQITASDLSDQLLKMCIRDSGCPHYRRM